MRNKLKVMRVVTASYVVPWHLGNTLSRITKDFDVTVVGQNVSLHSQVFTGVQFFDIDISRKGRYLSDVFAFFALCRFLVQCKPDIVHSIMPKAGLLTAIAGFVCRVPVRIHTFTGQIWAGRAGLVWYTLWLMDWMINRLNTFCLTDSHSQSDFLLRNGISQSGLPLPVLRRGSLTGVDVQRFNKENLIESTQRLKAELGIDYKNFVFSFIARKTQSKGAIDILKAFSRVFMIDPTVRLLFVGPDEDGEIERLKGKRPSLFSGVIDIGFVSAPEMYLALSDVLCLPSYREGFGSIVIDAASVGVPTIGSRIPGLVDAIVDGETGVLFPAGDIDELSDIMFRFCRNVETGKIMGRAAKKRAEIDFSADVLYAALKDFYLNSVSKVQKKSK